MSEAVSEMDWPLVVYSHLRWDFVYQRPQHVVSRMAGRRRVLFAPIGFVADHVETLYDLDHEAAERARALGYGAVARAPAMNDRPDFVAALEGLARRALGA